MKCFINECNKEAIKVLADTKYCNDCYSKLSLKNEHIHIYKTHYPRDAAGNRVTLPKDFKPIKKSYATGEDILSARQYSESLKRLNLAMKEVY